MISANGGLPAHRYTPQVTPRWPQGSEPASPPFSQRCYRSEVIEERTGGPQWAPTPPSMSQGHMEAQHTSYASPMPQGRGEDTENRCPTPYPVSS